MRQLEKNTVLRYLEEMRRVVEKMPEDARIGRMFIADDGQGIVLKSGVQEAARAFGEKAESHAVNEDWEWTQFCVGTLTVVQMDGRKQS